MSSGEKKALKILPISSDTNALLTGISSPTSSSRGLEAEMVIGKILGKKCPFLVRYDEIFSEGDSEYIIMELFSNGDLQKYLGGKKMPEKVFFFFCIHCCNHFYLNNKDFFFFILYLSLLFFKDIIRVAFQVASGLETLHKEKIIHRDIKLQNIFVTADGNFKLGMGWIY
jgi:serine/threonine protein kinase